MALTQEQLNEKFTAAFEALALACNTRFGLTKGGVDEYLARLSKIRVADADRDEVKAKLLASKSAYALLKAGSEPEAPVTKDDARFLENLADDIANKKDPLMNFIHTAKKYIRRRETGKFFIRLGLWLLVAAVVTGAYLALRMAI